MPFLKLTALISMSIAHFARIFRYISRAPMRIWFDVSRPRLEWPLRGHLCLQSGDSNWAEMSISAIPINTVFTVWSRRTFTPMTHPKSPLYSDRPRYVIHSIKSCDTRQTRYHRKAMRPRETTWMCRHGSPRRLGTELNIYLLAKYCKPLGCTNTRERLRVRHRERSKFSLQRSKFSLCRLLRELVDT
jgi:hypothetical protein